MRFTSRHGTTTALSNVSFVVRPAEIVTLVGPSGCGKSTILNLVAGFEAPSEGTITVDGVPVVKPGADRAMVFQTPALFPWFTVFNNIVYGPKRHGVPQQRYKEDATKLISSVGLQGFEGHYPYQLSGGMAQRVSIARALIGRPKALLLDEPFGALDAQTRLVMQRLLLQVWDAYKATILFVTHDVEEAVFLSDRVIVMDGRPGRINEDIAVDLPRPREVAIVTSAHFSSIRRRILGLILKENESIACSSDALGLTE